MLNDNKKEDDEIEKKVTFESLTLADLKNNPINHISNWRITTISIDGNVKKTSVTNPVFQVVEEKVAGENVSDGGQPKTED